MKNGSIKKKLVTSIMILISVIFACVISIVISMNLISLEKSVAKSKKYIWENLTAKGMTIVQNNSLAMSGMAEDNAFTAIQALVSMNVINDMDILYGIYMDAENVPWVYATRDNPEGKVVGPRPLTDSMSMWASKCGSVSYRKALNKNGEYLEFAAPVVFDARRLGVIRYGVSTQKLKELIGEMLAGSEASRNVSITIVLLLGILSLITGYLIIRQITDKITSPIASLVKSSQAIAGGNYDIQVTSESNDEVGNLAEHFETMRKTIKKYTDHLQDLIDEKMQQVNDILNNIDQGLFTINLDGTVNKEYSARANSILKINDLASHDIAELLRLDTYQKAAFRDWLKLVKNRHASQRWQKLTKLSPVQELELQQNESNTQQYVTISYQKIYDKAGNLSKIMVLAADETEKRLKDMQMVIERQNHENEVMAILGIANTPAEEIAEYTEDTTERLRKLKINVKIHLEGVVCQRGLYPDGPDYEISKENIDEMYRHIHTIKGNSGSFGFELMASIAHKTEDMLEELREPVKMRRGDSLGMIEEYLAKMDEAMKDIHQKIKLVYGRDDEITVRVPEHRIMKIQNMCEDLETRIKDTTVQPLFAECRMLTWKPLKALTRKYLKIVQKAERKQNKNIKFEVVDEMALYPSNELVSFDDAVVHLMHNAVDHGIEEAEIREELNKGVGKIKFEYFKNETQRILRISDDGRGIDIEKLVEKSIQKGILHADEIPAMSENDKLMLMFKAGVSTADTITDISGRGMGMNVVKEKVEGLGGKIEISTIYSKGTEMTIVLPVLNI
jgi:two-component system chemotaxis sensor kinase CheA